MWGTFLRTFKRTHVLIKIWQISPLSDSHLDSGSQHFICRKLSIEHKTDMFPLKFWQMSPIEWFILWAQAHNISYVGNFLKNFKRTHFLIKIFDRCHHLVIHSLTQAKPRALYLLNAWLAETVRWLWEVPDGTNVMKSYCWGLMERGPKWTMNNEQPCCLVTEIGKCTSPSKEMNQLQKNNLRWGDICSQVWFGKLWQWWYLAGACNHMPHRWHL